MTRALLLLTIAAGCSGVSRASDGRDDAGASFGGPPDASALPTFDAATSIDGSPGARDGGFSDGEFAPGARDPAESCFNRLDDDGNGAVDCEDPSCRRNVRACCVGVASSTCCAADSARVLEIAGCDGPLEQCTQVAASAAGFGSPRPSAARFEDEPVVIVPGASGGDSGLVLGAPIDARQRAVTLRALIAASARGHQEGPDSIGVGFSADESSTAPSIGLLVSGARGEALVVLGAEVIARWPLADDGFAEYAVTWRPDGTVHVSAGAARDVTLSGFAATSVRALLWGRSFNRADGDPRPARAQGVALQEEQCDMPTALAFARQPVVTDGLPATTKITGAPSVATIEGAPTAALAIDGAIQFARVLADGRLVVREDVPPLQLAGALLSNPVLRSDADAVEVWATARRGGIESIVRARSDAGLAFGAAAFELVLAGSADVAYEAAAPFGVGSERLLVAVRRADGVALELFGGEPWASLGVVHRPRADRLDAFDRDDVATPAVVEVGGVLRAYYAGRRGARWSIGLLVSPDGARWSFPGDGGRILTGSGAGFDALGTRAPRPFVEDDRSVVLYYLGDDGSRGAVGLATAARRE